MKRLRIGIMAALPMLPGCGSTYDQEAAFAPRATPLTMRVPDGVRPPPNMTLGDVEVTGIEVQTKGGFELVLFDVEAKFGGKWRLRAQLGGGMDGTLTCVGPTAWQRSDERVSIGVNRSTKLACRFEADGDVRQMLMYPLIEPGAPGLPEWLTTGPPRKMGQPREWLAVVLAKEGAPMAVERAIPTITVGQSARYYLYADGQVVASLDRSPGLIPQARIAEGITGGDRKAVIATLITTYLFEEQAVQSQ